MTNLEHIQTWWQTHADSVVVYVGGIVGALWKIDLQQIAIDLVTLQNFEGAIVVAIKATIGACIAWLVKRTCNFLTRKKVKSRKQ